jgi:hypothetical protein
MGTLKDKIDLIKKVRENFSKFSLDIKYKQIILELSIDEIISDEFEKEFLKLFRIDNNIRAIDYSSLEYVNKDEIKFIQVISDKYFFNEVQDKFSSSEMNKIIDKLINCMSAVDQGKNYLELYFKKIELLEYFIKGMVSRNLFKNLINKENDSYLKEIINDLMTSGTSETIKLVSDQFEKLNYDYTNFPLVITNKNLSSEEKITMIKSTYKQKDLHKYTSFIRNDLKDLNDLDSFIEATIVQNNRIKEKDTNVMDLFRRIFIGMRGDHFSSTEMLKKLENKATFFSKYKAFFTDRVIKNLKAIYEDSYYLRRNANNLIFEMFKDSTLIEKIRISSIDESLGEHFFSSRTELPAEAVGNKEAEMLFFQYVVKNNSLFRLLENNPEQTIKSINSFPEILIEDKIKKELSFDEMFSSYSFDDREESLARLFSSLEEPALKTILKFNEDYLSKFGMIEDKNSWDKFNSRSVSRFITRGFKVILATIRKSELAKKVIGEQFFLKFANEEYVSDLVSSFNSAMAEKEFCERLMRDLELNNTSDIVVRLASKIKDVLAKEYPENTDAVEGVNKFEKDLYILQSLS